MLLVFAMLAGGIVATVPIATPAFAASNWSPPASLDPGVYLDSVSCPTTTFCLVVDYQGDAFTYNGSTWTPYSGNPIPEFGLLDSVSCTSANFCAAVDTSGNAYTYNGTTWTPDPGNPIDPGNYFNIGESVSCTSANFCAAVDTSGNAFTYNGSGWTADPSNPIDAGHALSAVSCVSASFCAAVDYGGNAVTYNGSAWTPDPGNPIDPDGNSFNAVSCISANFCAAVDTSGNSFTYNGSGWTADPSNPIDPGVPGPALDAISCVSASFCAAVDSQGNALTYNGSAWTPDPGNPIDPGQTLNAISCASTAVCAAVDDNGNAFLSNLPSATTTCTSGMNCAATLHSPSQTVTVTGTKGTGTATVTLSIAPQVLACGAGFSYVAPVATLTDSGLAGTSLSVTDTVAGLPSKKGVLICYQKVQTPPPTPLLLAKCHRTQVVPPCYKTVTEDAGSALVTLELPPGDPKIHVGGETPEVTSLSPTRAAPNHALTIKGENLSEVTGVTIGGVTAVITKRAPTSVKVTVPPSAQSGVVRVTSLAGVAVSTARFTVSGARIPLHASLLMRGTHRRR